MNFLNKILSPETIDRLVETFEISILNNLNEDNFWQIVIYLQTEGIEDVEDIITTHLPLFLFDVNDFMESFTKLKQKYTNINEAINNDLNIFEEMYE